MNELQIHLLGGFRVDVGGHPVPDSAWGRPAARQVLKLLALQHGYRMHKEQVQDTLWPELGADTVDSSFRRAVHFCRHALEPNLAPRQRSRFLGLRDDLVSLEPEQTSVDVAGFEAAVHAGLEREDPKQVEKGLEMYAGPLLPEDQYAEWTQAARERYASLRLTALVRLGGLLLDRDLPDRAELFLEKAIGQDPAQEEAFRLLIVAAAQNGNRAGIAHVYERCRQAMHEEMGVDPDHKTQELFREAMSGRLASRRPSRAHQGPPAAFVMTRPPLPAPVHQGNASSTFGRTETIGSTLSWLGLRHSSEGSTAPPLLVLAGAMGVGKTHIARVAANSGHASGASVLWGGWSELEYDIPYAGFIQALDWLASKRSESQLDDPLRYPELTRLLPSSPEELSPHEFEPGDQGQSRRARLYSSIARLLSDLESIAPVLFVLDDLQFCDKASTELLAFLVRLAPGHRWAFLATIRGGTASESLTVLRNELRRHGLIREEHVEPLQRETTAELIRSTAPSIEGAIGDEILALSAGNPLFALELARTAEAPGSTRGTRSTDMGAGSHGLEVPRTLKDLFSARMARLGEGSRRVLEAGCVLGHHWSLPEIASVLDEVGSGNGGRMVILDQSEELCRLEFLFADDDGFGFQHPLFLSIMYASLSGERRKLLHAAAGVTIEALRPEDIDTLATHFERSHDDTRAILYLEAAGDRAAALYANETALDRFGATLERTPREREGDRARLDEKRGRVLLTLGRLGEAEEALESAKAFHDGCGDVDASARVLAQLGRVWRVRGRALEAVSRLEAQTVALGTNHKRGLAEVTSVLARLLATTGQYADSIVAAEAALSLGEELGDEQIVADSAVARANVLLMSGQVDLGRRALLEAIPPTRASGDLNLLQVVLANLAEVNMIEGRYADALENHSKALQIVRQMGDPNRISFAESAVGIALMMVGRWQQARSHLEVAQQFAEGADVSWYSAYPLIHLGRLEFYSGRQREARRLLQKAATLTEGRQDTQASIFAQVALAECDLLAQMHQQALDRLQPLMRLDDEAGADLGSILILAARSLTQLGSMDEAIALLRRVLSRAESDGAVGDENEGLLAFGPAVAARGDVGEASGILARALQISTATGDLFSQARARREIAALAIATGDERAAREHARLARKTFVRLGARAFLEEGPQGVARVV